MVFSCQNRLKVFSYCSKLVLQRQTTLTIKPLCYVFTVQKDKCRSYTTARVFVLVKSTLKMLVMCTVFSMRILISQSPHVSDNALSYMYSVTHLHVPVYQFIQLIYQRESIYIIAHQRRSALKCIAAQSINIGRIKDD